MRDDVKYLDSTSDVHKRRRTAAKMGIVTGAAGFSLSWAINTRFIESSLAQSQGLLGMAALAGLLSMAVSVRYLRSVSPRNSRH